MAEMKKAELTIGERVIALRIFDAFKGSLATLAVLLEDVKKVAISDEEWEKAELKKIPNADGTEQWKWNDIGVKEVELDAVTSDYLKAEIKRRSDAGEVTLADVALVTLDEKLK